MPGPFKDNNNTGLFNFTVHPCSSVAGRGIPAVGKVVYRIDLQALYVCTSTSPDAGEVGGGTWEVVGGGVWTDYTPTLTAVTTNPTANVGHSIYGRWSRSNDTIDAQVYIQFDLSAEGAGGYRISLPVASRLSEPSARLLGHGWLNNGSDWTQCWALGGGVSGTVSNLLFTMTGGGNLVGPGVPWAWTGSQRNIAVHFRYEAA